MEVNDAKFQLNGPKLTENFRRGQVFHPPLIDNKGPYKKQSNPVSNGPQLLIAN